MVAPRFVHTTPDQGLDAGRSPTVDLAMMIKKQLVMWMSNQSYLFEREREIERGRSGKWQ